MAIAEDFNLNSISISYDQSMLGLLGSFVAIVPTQTLTLPWFQRILKFQAHEASPAEPYDL